MNSKKLMYIGLTTILVISVLAMSTAIASADDCGYQENHLDLELPLFGSAGTHDNFVLTTSDSFILTTIVWRYEYVY